MYSIHVTRSGDVERRNRNTYEELNTCILSEDRSEVILTMTSYIDGVVETFSEYLPKKPLEVHPIP